MAALYREFDRKDFEIVRDLTNTTVNARKMRAFVAQFRPPFRSSWRWRMKAEYHYRGLPYSVLLDRQRQDHRAHLRLRRRG